MGADNEGCFKCTKITLMVFYILSLIGTTILVILAIVGLAGLSGSKSQDEKHKEDAEIAKSLFTAGLAIGLIAMLMNAMGLYGVIKENKWIMVLMTALGVVAFISYAVTRSIIPAGWTLFVTILTGLYAKQIFAKQNMYFDNKV